MPTDDWDQGNPRSAKCRHCGGYKEQQISAGNKYLVCPKCDLKGARTVVPPEC